MVGLPELPRNKHRLRRTFGGKPILRWNFITSNQILHNVLSFLSGSLELSDQPRAHSPSVSHRTPRFASGEIAAELGITERHAYASIVTELADAGYIVKLREGRRNRYQVQSHLALPELPDREQAIGDVLDILTSSRAKRKPTQQA